MSHIDIIKEAYDKVGIGYVIKVNGDYSYLVKCAEHNRDDFEKTPYDILIRYNDFIEFMNGSIASY